MTLMEGLGCPPDDPEAIRKELVAAVSQNLQAVSISAVKPV